MKRTTRRDFLKTTLAAGTASVPYFWTSRQSWGQDLANDKLGIGSIGTGGRGSGIGRDACRRGNAIAVADVDSQHAERFASNFEGMKIYQDYRKLLDHKDIDVVTIGTPDHWHVKIAIEALQAGKHVYCEKPLTLTIDEGKKICQVVKETEKVFQVGTQQRSDGRFRLAVAIARSGMLGRPLKATCSIGGAPGGGPWEPVSDVFTHHRELSSCHMCNIAMLLKRKLRWDPVEERFIDDDEANSLLSRPQREPYAINV